MHPAGVLFLVLFVFSLWLTNLLWPLVIAAIIIRVLMSKVNKKEPGRDKKKPGQEDDKYNHVDDGVAPHRPVKFHKKKYAKQAKQRIKNAQFFSGSVDYRHHYSHQRGGDRVQKQRREREPSWPGSAFPPDQADVQNLGRRAVSRQQRKSTHLAFQRR